jgi:uncharacterized protein YbjT (DUF2867 family)
MQNTFAQAANIRNQSKIVLPFPADQRLAFIDVRDTGALGARILLEPEAHVGKTYAFTGRASSYAELAGVFSEVLGRPIAFVSASLDQAEAGMKAAGLPEWLVGHLLIMAKAGAEGAFDNENMGPIRDIVGREPITTRQFVEDHRQMFA